MKAIQFTTTGSLFNHTGILQHAGDYAGRYQEEAFELLKDSDFKYDENSWGDIMHDKKGVCYAVIANGELNSFDSDCYYAQIDSDDCEHAINSAIEHISN